MTRFLASAWLLALAACSGGSDATTGASPNDPASEGGGTASTPPGASAHDAGTDSGSPAGDAGGDPPARDTRLFPAEVGRSWTFTGSDSSGSLPPTYKTEIVDRRTIDGRNAYVVRTAGIDSFLDVQGDDVFYRGGSSWYPSMKAPVQEGATWTYQYAGTRMQTWHEVGSVTVAAGTFAGCWRIDYRTQAMGAADVSYSVTCRGVGTVQSITEVGTYVSRYQLSAKSF